MFLRRQEKIIFKAIPQKAHLTALHVICWHIFRHLTQKFLDIRQYGELFQRSNRQNFPKRHATYLMRTSSKQEQIDRALVSG